MNEEELNLFIVENDRVVDFQNEGKIIVIAVEMVDYEVEIGETVFCKFRYLDLCGEYVIKDKRYAILNGGLRLLVSFEKVEEE